MKTSLFTGLLLLIASTSLWAAVADDIAIAIAQERGWEAIEFGSDLDPIELITREKMVEHERLGRMVDEEGQLDEIVVAKKKKFLGQEISEYYIYKMIMLPGSNEPMWVYRPMSEKERIERKAAYGDAGERIAAMSDALKASGHATSHFAAVLDGLSGFEIGSADSVAYGTTSAGSVSRGGGAACEDLIMGGPQAKKKTEYSDWWAGGLNPRTGRFSFSTFLTGPACMFLAVGEYLSSLKDDVEFDCNANCLEKYLQALAPDKSGIEITGSHGRADDASAVVRIALDAAQSSAGAGGGSPLLLLAGSVSALSPTALTGGTQVQLDDGSTVVFDSLEKAIDLDAYVTTLIRLCGTRAFEGKSQDICVEREMGDFRTVPGTGLYEPYRETFRMRGMFSDEERAELAEAEAKLEEYERQLASMPASQRAMMERMIGPQIAQYRDLVEGSDVAFTIITTDIIINPYAGDPENSIVAAVERDSQERLLRRIQQDLETLGYEPGVLNGELVQQTVVAIVRFEGDQGMPITGEPSETLANALTLAVAEKKSGN